MAQKFLAFGNKMRGEEKLTYYQWAMLKRCLLVGDVPRPNQLDAAQVEGQAEELRKVTSSRLQPKALFSALVSAYYSGLKKLEAYEAGVPTSPKKSGATYYWQDKD